MCGACQCPLAGVRNEPAKGAKARCTAPAPRGGEDRAFTVPLPGFLPGLLRRRRDENRVLFGDDSGWAFPSRSTSGRVTHVREAKEQRYAPRRTKGEKLRKVNWLPSPHRLRDTFVAACVESGHGGDESARQPPPAR